MSAIHLAAESGKGEEKGGYVSNCWFNLILLEIDKIRFADWKLTCCGSLLSAITNVLNNIQHNFLYYGSGVYVYFKVPYHR